MTIEEDVEAVKRAADRQRVQHTHDGLTDCEGSLEDCPRRESSTGTVEPKQRGRLVEGDIVRVGQPVDEGLEAAKQFVSNANAYDSVNPPHYRRGPLLRIDIGEQITKGISTVHHTVSCIEVMRHITDPRLATALRYLWRVAFGGKRDPKETEQGRQKDVEDIEKAIWYLRDWVTNPTTD